MTNKWEYSTAVHEAAHAVVRIACGLDFWTIEVFDEELGGEILGMMDRGENRLEVTEIPSDIVSALASLHAERLIHPYISLRSLAKTRCRGDWDEATEMCDLYGYDVDQMLRISGKMVRTLKSSVFKVADRLFQCGQLTCDQVLETCPDLSMSIFRSPAGWWSPPPTQKATTA